MEKVSPSDPKQKGIPGPILQDGMSDAGSKEQANHAGNKNKKDEREEK
jgi:hypothetical protein